MYKNSTKKEAIMLYKKGHSVSYIAKKLHIRKTSRIREWYYEHLKENTQSFAK